MGKTASEKYFDKIAEDYDFYKKKNSFYYENLKKILSYLIPEGKKVFEIGCGTGDLLVSLKPKVGYGMDISDKMIAISKIKYQNLKNITFSTQWPNGKFDYIFMSDVIEHLENPQEIFRKISKLMDKDTVFVNTMANPIWEPILLAAEKLGLKMKEGPHKRVVFMDLRIMIQGSGMRIIKHDYKLLIPIYIPFVTAFINKYFEKYFKHLTSVEYFVAKTK